MEFEHTSDLELCECANVTADPTSETNIRNQRHNGITFSIKILANMNINDYIQIENIQITTWGHLEATEATLGLPLIMGHPVFQKSDATGATSKLGEAT